MHRGIDQLNVVVTCAARKSRSPLPGLAVRDIADHDFSSRLSQWVSRLERSRAEERIVASSLYQGDHWATVRRLLSDIDDANRSVKVWIASAGCGLLSPQTLIPPYAATFSPNEPDSVAENVVQRRLWWSGLGRMQFSTEGPRSLEALVKSSPESALLVAASPEYLSAISGDLEKAAAAMARTEALVVLCRAGVKLGALDHAKVYLGADLSVAVGGALTSLNARVARWLISHLQGSFDRGEVHQAIDELRSACKRRPSTVRTKSSDEQISKFARDLLANDREASGSAALASFRRAGMAAEQRRFQDLFKAAKREVLVG